MEISSHNTPYAKKSKSGLYNFLNYIRRFSTRCREADAMIRRL
ncbi:MAG TPA: hypothetical protein VLL47_05335 [Robiginitalea sp.]|nr:hypothetical protein [Robiginitalea sp.]